MIGLTGCTGFIGSHLARELTRSGKTIKILVRENKKLPLSLRHDSIEVMTGDLLKPHTLTAFCRNCELLVHIAGIVKGPGPGAVMSVNRDGTYNLLEQARTAHVQKCVYISSGAVDFLDGEYAQSKSEAEQIVKASGLDWTILRPSEIYGPGDRSGITSLLPKIRKWPVFPIIGDGSYTLQPLFVLDLVEAINTSIDRFSSTQGKIIHLAGPEPLPYKRIIETIASALDKKIRTVSIPVSLALLIATIIGKTGLAPFIDRQQIERVLVAKHWDITVARQLLDFSPRPFKHGITQALRPA